MVCLWHTMLVNNWKELKSSNYMGLLMETAILLLWHALASIVALARSAALMEAELLSGTTKGFTHSLTSLNRSEALKCAVAWDQGAGQGWRQRHCLPTPHLQHAGIHFQACSWLSHCKDGCSQRQPDILWEWTDTKGTIPALPGQTSPPCLPLAGANRTCSPCTPKYSWWQKKPFCGAFSAVPRGRSRETMTHIPCDVLRGCSGGEFRTQ